MSQITILKPDNSFVEAFFVSESLTTKLKDISRVFELNCLNLAFLIEIRKRVLSVCSQKIKTTDLATVQAMASVNLDWFDELVTLIDAISKLSNPHSLPIRFN